MDTIAKYVGRRIKFFRKKRRLTLEALADKISKSKSTVYKYENGAIPVDIETLFDIAKALEVDVVSLTDYQPPLLKNPFSAPLFFDQPEAYLYCYDGRIRKRIEALLTFHSAACTEEETQPVIRVTMYDDVKDFKNYEKCRHLYSGNMELHETVTYFLLKNQVNETERLFISVLNPFRYEAAAAASISAISANPFAAVSLKALISKTVLCEDSPLLASLVLAKKDLRNIKEMNMFTVQHLE